MLTGPRLDPLTATSEFVLSLAATARQSAEGLFSELATKLRERDATIVALFVYGDIAGREQASKVMRRYLGAIDWPVLWVEGRSCDGALVSGLQAFAVTGVEVERMLVKGRIMGTTYSVAGAKHCLVAGLGPDDPRASREDQARQCFENAHTALATAGFDFCDIARTWFYNDRLLDWYDVFNRVRTQFYATRPFRSGTVPASTGVEARNTGGAALAMAAWAVQPLIDAASVREVTSPRQCPAPQYGSSFSRAMEITDERTRRLLISGTASIDREGKSVWKRDITRQVATTMDVIGAILASRGMRLHDATRATAYFKYPLDTAAFVSWQEEHGVRLPAVFVHCDICRDDLLFELELDAVVPR